MQEEGLAKLLDNGMSTRIIRRADSVNELVKNSDIVFVAVQTPHAAGYGGETPMPETRQDFEYQYLVQACRDVCQAALWQERHLTLAVVSTVLPGTISRLIRPLLNRFVALAYTPQFVAMGTTIADFTDPEFVICGVSDPRDANPVTAVFSPVHGEDRLFICDITTAESIKVFYNTYVSMKIVWANHVMEMCHKTGADCDKVVDALSQATQRVISPRYMRGGMGDGGACHPRDLIALNWLEFQLGMSVPWFGMMAAAREYQAQWLAGQVRHYVGLTGAPVLILGKSYKAGSAMLDGSPALLLRSLLDDLHPVQWDPHVPSDSGDGQVGSTDPWVYVIATRHPEFPHYPFHPGSVVIDPFGYIPDQDGCTVIRVGRHRYRP